MERELRSLTGRESSFIPYLGYDMSMRLGRVLATPDRDDFSLVVYPAKEPLLA